MRTIGFFTNALFSGLISMFLLGMVCVAQEKSGDTLVVQPRACEFNNRDIEEAFGRTEKDSTMILIAVSGKDDTDSEISAKRLHSSRVYLEEVFGREQSKRIIFARRIDPSYQYGGVEIYVNGKLFDVLTGYGNSPLRFGDCTHPDSDDTKSRRYRARLYPWEYDKPAWKELRERYQ